MSREINTLYRFDGFELNPSNRVFAFDGPPIVIPARAFDLLLYMVRNPERLLPKEELMKAVWGDMIVEEGNLTQNVFLLRKALSAHSSTESKLIVTMAGRGYWFGGKVERIAVEPAGTGALEMPVNAAAQPAQIPPAVPQAGSKRMYSKRWFILGALAGAAALAALIVFPGGAIRPRNKPIPLPHRVTASPLENPLFTTSISPDGKYLAYVDPRAITIKTLHSGETRSISWDPGGTPGGVFWYPDGTRLLVGETVKDLPSIFALSILSGKFSPLRENARGPAVSPDGARIAFTDGSRQELWLMGANGENVAQILTVTAPDKLYAMFWSPDNGRIWFARVHWDKDHEAITIESCDFKGASQTVALSDARLRAFNLLPRGRLIYALKENSENFTNLWELPVDTVHGKAAGPPRKLTDWTGFSISIISATADGKHVAILNGTWQADVYVGDLRAGGAELVNTRRFTLDDSDDAPAFWTPDDQAVVFESNRNGRSQVFRQRLDQSAPELLSMDSGEAIDPQFGGQWIYYRSVPLGGRTSWNELSTMRRLPLNGGASSDVLRDVGMDIGCASAQPQICVIERLRGNVLRFYRFDHDKGQGAEIGHMEFESNWFPYFDVSPDGSEIAAVDQRGAGNRIRRIPMNGAAASEVEVPGRRVLAGLYWASDGKGWFANSTTPANGEYLLHVNLRGESQVLYEQPEDGRTTYGIPSHDGRHLAFLRWTAATNVWMIDDF